MDRKWSTVLLGIIFFTVLFGLAGQSKTARQTVEKSVFAGSFIQYELSQNWDQNRWKRELTTLRKAGIKEIILQGVVNTTPNVKYAAYPTWLPGFTSNSIDMLDNAFSAADSLGMKVRVGTAFNNEWWSKGTADVTWLSKEANINKEIVNEIALKYAWHPSISGWYIPYEFSNITAITRMKQTNLNSYFFRPIAAAMKSKTPSLNIMVSPFYNSKYSWLVPLSSWSSSIANILRGTEIDIVALQDGVGTGYNTTGQLGKIFSHTKKGTNSIGLTLFANIETFKATPVGNKPAAQSRITTQLTSVNPYVEGYVAFSLNHFPDGH